MYSRLGRGMNSGLAAEAVVDASAPRSVTLFLWLNTIMGFLLQHQIGDFASNNSLVWQGGVFPVSLSLSNDSVCDRTSYQYTCMCSTPVKP